MEQYLGQSYGCSCLSCLTWRDGGPIKKQVNNSIVTSIYLLYVPAHSALSTGANNVSEEWRRSTGGKIQGGEKGQESEREHKGKSVLLYVCLVNE